MPRIAIGDRKSTRPGMGNIRTFTLSAGQPAVSALRAALCAAAILFGSALAAAQQPAPVNPAPQPVPAVVEDHGFFATVGRWFDEQAANLKSGLHTAGSKVKDFSHDAGVAAKSTVDTAKDAAGAVARIPNARMATGHEVCTVAANGAPDCVAAANALCKVKGFDSGKSMDMTTAEVCPTQVYLSGRTSGPGCHKETFVSRAICQ
jgi:hypothetical protein